MGKPVTTSRISPEPDCAYCRKSEYAGKAFACKLGLPMDATRCATFKDSRKQSSVAVTDYLLAMK